MLKQGAPSSETALCSPYDDQEAQPLLLGTYYSSHIRSAISACPAKQRSNGVEHTVGSGNRLM
jgi:hypothetical protein